MDWTDISDILRAALAFFLVVSGLGVAWVCVKLGSVLGALAGSVRRMTDGAVPILERAQTTVDGVNLQLTRVDDIMVSAVGATKGAEKAVGSVANAVATPVRSVSGLAAKVQESVRTFQARRKVRRDDATAPPAASPATAAAPTQPPAPTETPSATSDTGSMPVVVVAKGPRGMELPYPAAPAHANGRA